MQYCLTFRSRHLFLDVINTTAAIRPTTQSITYPAHTMFSGNPHGDSTEAWTTLHFRTRPFGTPRPRGGT
jgi:hypothetical protein